MRAIKFEAARIHFLSVVFVAVAVVLLLKLPNVRRARLTFEIIRQYVDWARIKCPLFA